MFLDYLPHTIGFILLLYFSLFFTDILFGTISYDTGSIIEKQYIPSSFETGVGTSISPSGQMGVVTTTRSSDEKFIITLRNPKGDIIVANTTSDLYYNLEKGENVEVSIITGYLTKIKYSITVTKKILVGEAFINMHSITPSQIINLTFS